MARKILLADDSVTAQNMGRKILTDAGYEVIAVNNGSAALKKIAEHKPDLIVLDVYMPGYSGLEVCQRIKENRETARIPVLLTVGKLEPFKPEEARKARADAFVVKPFEASELLTAITKLEDKIVPQPESYKPGRFAKAIQSLEEPASDEKFGDADEGWKARLRFPSRKKQASEPPEEAPEIAPQAGKGLGDTLANESRSKHSEQPKAAPAEHAPAQFERAMPAGLPHDITPEEIAAITAAAAQLSGKTSATQDNPAKVEEAPAPAANASAELVPPAGDAAKSPDVELSVVPDTETASSEDAVAQSTKVEAVETSAIAEPAAPIVSAPELDESVPMTFADAHGPEIESSSAAEAVSSVVVPETETSTPAAQSDASHTEAKEQPTEVAEMPVVAAAPIDEMPAAAEPIVLSSESAVAELSVAADEPAAVVASNPVEPPVAVQDIELTAAEPQPEPKQVAEAESATPSEPAAQAPSPVVPHDEDVMAALQTLIPEPSPGSATISAIAEDAQTRVAASSNELTYVGSQGTGSRWIAEEVTLSAQESALSLEQEMEKAYSAFAASEAARLLASSVLDTFPGSQPVVPVAAVAETEASAEIPADPALASILEAAEIAIPAVAETNASAMAFVARAADAGSSSGNATASASMETVMHTPAEASVVAEGAAFSEPEIATGSEAASQISSVEPEQVVATHSENHTQEIDEAGGVDDMGKNSEGFGFKMIRQSPAGTSKSATKSEPVSKENFEPVPATAEPAAMAAAAAAESAPAAASAPALAPTDPKAIASIVDSVLAELRPKIVEEIAKKLAGDPHKE